MIGMTEGFYCGVFDSSILRKSQVKSQDRIVKSYELEVFHTDTGVSYVQQGRYPTCRGMLLCAKPGQIRHSDFPVRCSYIRIPQGSDKEIEGILQALPDCTYLENESDIDELLSLFSRLGAYFVSAAAGETALLRINALLLEILYHIGRLCRGQMEKSGDAPVSRITREAYEYIGEHYCEDCSLQTIADAVQISPNHLHAVFQRDMGMTPYAYTLQKRIVRAQRLIMTGEMSMMEIALETGFCSQSHFNKVFRQKTGLTPVQYRKKLLEQY